MNKILKATLLSIFVSQTFADEVLLEANADISNWVATYHLLDQDGAEKSVVTHTSQRVCLDNICANSINISSSYYNGIPLSNPIIISVDMEKPAFETNLSIAGLNFKEADA